MKMEKKVKNRGTFCGDADHYEDIQNFNLITKFLHRTRFRNLEKLIVRASKEKNEKLNIIDIGCGDSSAYSTINALNLDFNYIGIELREDFCNIANKKYSNNNNFQIIQGSIENHFEQFSEADVIIGLESFEHMPPQIVFRTIEAISKSPFMYLYVTVPNEVGPAVLIKNVGSAIMRYERHLEYEWRETFYSSIYDLDKVKRHNLGHKGFDWRWLAQTLRLHTIIIKKTSSPTNLMPKFLSPSIGFICVRSVNNNS